MKKLLTFVLVLAMVLSVSSVALATENAAKIGTTEYATLKDAVDAAKDGDTITLLNNSDGNGIVFPNSKFKTTGLTIDFAGYTYNVTGETVGSSGTETNGFQILKGNKVVFKDGTLTTEKAKILVQNYSDLTLDNMKLNGDAVTQYVLSNNCGTVVINDTTITAPSGAVAFDVYKYSSYKAPHVTVKGSSVINGKVEVDIDNGNPSGDGNPTLIIEGGEFKGEINKKDDHCSISISGGTFSEMPNPAYIADDKGAVQNPDGTYSLVDAITGEYGLKIYPASLDFGTEKVGYAQPAPKAVFIQGIDGRSVTVTVPDEYEICGENGELIDNPVTIEDSPNNDGITVGIVYIRPKAGLGAGKYTGSVNVSVTNASETPEINNKPALSFAVETPYATGSGISVKYTGGNGFSTSNPEVPTVVEIDNVPVSFTGDGRNFTVSCIKPDSRWITVRWNSTSVTTNFTPDAAAYCSPTNIPKTGDASLAAFVVMAIAAAAGAMRRK